MSLEKGFLRESSLKIYRWLIFAAMLLSIVIGFALYAILVYSMEVFRSATTDLVKQLLILSETDIQFYGYALAFLASVIGQGFGLQLLLANTGRPKNFKTRFAKRNLQNQISFNLWVYLYWIAKWLSTMGIIYATLALHYEVDLKAELGYLFFLLPFALFLSYWLGAYKLFRKNIYKWMLGAFLQIVLVTLIIGNIRVVNHQFFNGLIEQQFPELKYEMEIPESMTQWLPRRPKGSVEVDLIWQDEQTKVYFKYYDMEPISLKDAAMINQFRIERHSVVEIERTRLYLSILADTRVPLNDLLRFEKLARQEGYHNFWYLTSTKNSIYPWHHPSTRKSGIFKYLPGLCEKEQTTLDSLRQLGYKAEQIRWPDFECYYLSQVMKENRVLIRQTRNGVYLNSEKLEAGVLLQTLTELVKVYPDINLIYLPEPDLKTGQYIQGRDLLMQAVIKNRIRRLKEKWDLNYNSRNERFDHLYGKEAEAYADVQSRYPMNIIELTGWNLEFYQYFKE